ncbi:MAG TPA: L-fucokinase [Phycisphaerae bacterium]|nr:L-fucokinase [Phycisphaerae bacterium]
MFTIGWDYLILTASNAAQAAAYEEQLALRRRLGLIGGVRQVMVVPDPPGLRVGSGGSTILCLCAILQRELSDSQLADSRLWLEVLRRLRVLIIHGGGDSRRLPAYGPCGKLFIPLPGTSDSAVGLTLFDAQLPTFLALPSGPPDAGQVIVTSGDVLLGFDPGEIHFADRGLTGLGCRSEPEQAGRHGVFCVGPDGSVRLFLQKPSPQVQAERGAIDRYGQTLLDIGVMSFDASTAVALLKACGVGHDDPGRLAWSGPTGDRIEQAGMDFYCEICCSLGAAASPEEHAAAAHAAGSRWSAGDLNRLFHSMRGVEFHVHVLSRCEFLHFGTTRQIIGSGLDCLRAVTGVSKPDASVSIQNKIGDGGSLTGVRSWVEACDIRSRLELGGDNVVVGADVTQPTRLPPGACVDLMPGRDRQGRPVWFVRCCGVDDSFKPPAKGEPLFHASPLSAWLHAVGAKPEDVWDNPPAADKRDLWQARLFPAETESNTWHRWLWMFDPDGASDEQRRAWLAADRYSPEEIARLGDPAAFYECRLALRADELRTQLRKLFRIDSGFSADDLALFLERAEHRDTLLADLLAEAHWHAAAASENNAGSPFALARILHTLASAVVRWAGDLQVPLSRLCPSLAERLTPRDLAWLESNALDLTTGDGVGVWASRAKEVAFKSLRQAIQSTGDRLASPPVCRLRSDEIVWGRVPARLDLGGGWTDTPPYSLEFGGCVLNAAVNLNGQPPIQCYARIIPELVIRVSSIDLGARQEITDLPGLLDYRCATGDFALAKAVLALSGFAPESAEWPAGSTLKDMLTLFGGGIELTTLAAVPKGSGLGTSSIMGAVILSVVQRVAGRTLSHQELFGAVLRMEQALTTGGGWQDQIGGVVPDVKLITAQPALVPDPHFRWVPGDVLDPRANSGQTLLYYTGITRLAKNILQQVVGRYLDRDRPAMATLRELHRLPERVAEAMARKDLQAFGTLVADAWRLNKQLDPDSSNPAIESLLARIEPHIWGAKLLGAGGGGFLLMVCRSIDDAQAVRDMLQKEPPNDRARFFDFDISREGLVVTVC